MILATNSSGELAQEAGGLFISFFVPSTPYLIAVFFFRFGTNQLVCLLYYIYMQIQLRLMLGS